MADDRFSPRGDVSFQPAGVGLMVTFRCGKCDRKSTQLGSRMQRVRGLRQRVCGACVQAGDAPGGKR